MTRGNGPFDPQNGVSPERNGEVGMLKPAWPQFDLTPEVFRRFMTYESAFASDDIPRSASYHLLNSASNSAGTDAQLASSFVSTPGQAQGAGRRLIRGVPRKADANAPTSASSARPAPPAHSASSSSVPAQPHSASHPTIPQMQSDSLASQSLAQYFQQLKVSAKAQRPFTSQSSAPSQPQIQQEDVESRITNSPPSFNFPALPVILTDDGYNHRHRAAQFILLYSQQANSEELSLCKRLSLPLRRDASGLFKPRSRGNSASRSKAKGRPAVEGTARSSQDDGESVGSHDHSHNASGDESDHLDFEGCHSAHLGNNKKKRKSSRFNSPTSLLAATPDKSVQVPPLDTNPSATLASYVSVPAESATRGRVLADKTNTVHQNTARASRPTEKPKSVLPAPFEPSFLRRDPVWRPPPRQTIGDRHRDAIRKRMRLRLAPILQQRKLDRAQEVARVSAEQRARAEAIDQQAKAHADAQVAGVPVEKRIPPKRTSKAGKRAQAIRGGNASANPLTIAEIRARAAAAAGGPASSSAAAAKSKPAPAPNSTTSSRVATRNSSPTPAKDLGPAVSRSSSVVGPPRMERNLSSISAATSSKIALASPSKPAPASDFTFRMSSAVTIRLGEMRAQLDAATRELSDTTLCEDPRGIVKALGESMYLPQTQKASSQAIQKTIQHQHHPDVPGRVTSEQRPQINTSEAVPSAAAIAPRPQDKAQQGRRTSSSAVHRPTPSPASTTKKTNGRHKPASPAHKHTAACKHGHAPPAPGTTSALFTDADWICLFCEYELYYGAPPLMLRACRNRKKLVEKKSRSVGARKKASGKARGCEHTCHDHASVSDDCHHHHDHEHERGHGHGHGHEREGRRSGRHPDRPPREKREGERDRCDCGNSIHSSDFDDDDQSSTCF
ncbi:hypothetical protein PSEUBRA_004263 [Kalmanozyma brasiliensis GHG001]|uniref:uncharacterized protein n=1 Tax=Kalmanozyma brasiliensis (strain GHG001) TaxID=1365824 RepID=UPI002867D7F5|nr:uncharacterized protein PSEUBRA_004263 [Kalmanozyma brasiliensis GHG001]KAF6767362.1 hypothetical protein PSEUBRA_004263 [Kalmanozyma brasiliensis GHG001]